MTVFFEFGLNLLVAALLGATIFYCWLLNKRIQVLQNTRGELAMLLKHFDQSTQKAADSITALQAASKKIGETVQSRIEKANHVMDDLTFMIDRAEKVADQMEAGLAIARQNQKMTRPAEIAAAEYAPLAQDNRNKAQEDLVEEARAAVKNRSPSSLQALIEKAAQRGSDPVLRGKNAAAIPARGRSRSEEELLATLKTGTKV